MDDRRVSALAIPLIVFTGYDVIHTTVTVVCNHTACDGGSHIVVVCSVAEDDVIELVACILIHYVSVKVDVGNSLTESGVLYGRGTNVCAVDVVVNGKSVCSCIEIKSHCNVDPLGPTVSTGSVGTKVDTLVTGNVYVTFVVSANEECLIGNCPILGPTDRLRCAVTVYVIVITESEVSKLNGEHVEHILLCAVNLDLRTVLEALSAEAEGDVTDRLVSCAEAHEATILVVAGKPDLSLTSFTVIGISDNLIATINIYR